jgi:hypothetical protein
VTDKNFIVKNGLVVGNTATINGVVIDPAGASSGQVLKFDGTKFVSAAQTIANADVSVSAAIDYNKLAALTSGNILVGNASNVATSTAVTGDITITNAGVTAIASGVIVNADINASAAIALSKLSTTGAASGYVISYNGTSWAASQLSNNSYNLDGGTASSTYGGITSLDGGNA